MPKPTKIGRRLLWDIRDLDTAFDLLKSSKPDPAFDSPKDSEQDRGPNPWD